MNKLALFTLMFVSSISLAAPQIQDMPQVALKKQGAIGSTIPITMIKPLTDSYDSLSYRFTTGPDANYTGTISVGQHLNNGSRHVSVISTSPGNFNPAHGYKGCGSPTSYLVFKSIRWNTGIAWPSNHPQYPYHCWLKPNTTYYLNIKSDRKCEVSGPKRDFCLGKMSGLMNYYFK